GSGEIRNDDRGATGSARQDFLLDPRQVILPEVAQHERRSFLGELQGDRATYAPCCTGDDYDLIFQVEVHSLSLSVYVHVTSASSKRSRSSHRPLSRSFSRACSGTAGGRFSAAAIPRRFISSLTAETPRFGRDRRRSARSYAWAARTARAVAASPC